MAFMDAPKRRAAAAVLLFGALALLFFGTRSWNFNFDGVCFAQHIESGQAQLLFHPNHLLYTAAGKLYGRVESRLIGPGRALLSLQRMGIWAGAAAGALLFFILSRLFHPLGALIAAAGFCVTYGFWLSAADVQAYVPAALAGLGPLYFLLAEEPGSPLLAGAATALFALCHQLGALCALPLAWLYFKRGGFRPAAAYFLTTAWLSLGAYAIVLYTWPVGGPREALRWFMGNSVPLSAGDPLWQNLAHSSAGWLGKSRALDAELGVWLLGPRPPGLLGPLAAFAMPALLAWLAWRSLALKGKDRNLAARLWGWIGVYLFFLTLPHGLHSGYLIFAFLPLPALILLVLERAPADAFSRPLRAVFAGLVLCVFISSLNAALEWRRPEKNEDLARTAGLARIIGPRDYFLFGGGADFSMGRAYLPYFSAIDGTSLTGFFWRSGARDLGALGPKLREVFARGGCLYLSPGLLAPAELDGLERQFHLAKGSLSRAFSALELEPVGPAFPEGRLLRLKAGAALPPEFAGTPGHK